MMTPQATPGRARAFLARRILVLAGAIALGLVLQQALRARLDGIAALADRDVLAARAELALVLRVVGTIVFGMTGALGVAIMVTSRRVRNARERLGVGLGVALVAASAAAFALLWYMAAVLAACRA